jgi:hypothetical protein
MEELLDCSGGSLVLWIPNLSGRRGDCGEDGVRWISIYGIARLT